MTGGQRWTDRRHAAGRAIRRRLWELRLALPPGRPPRLPAWTGPATSLPPLLVGGTGRSGTTITARILGAHPDYHMIPFEVRFLSEPGGLCDVVAGRATVMAFERRLFARWFDRGTGLGLHAFTDRTTLRAALGELNEGLRHDPRAAGERFVHRLLDPVALAAGARGWIEMTPGTVHVAPELLAILPTARLVHSVRDGRDVACSVAPLDWGPADLDAALDWWARSLERAYAQCAVAPADRVLAVRMETLLRVGREGEYARLRAFAGLDDDPAMRAFFDGRAAPERAHVGRWHADVPPALLGAFDARYHEHAARLAGRWGYEIVPTGAVPVA